VPTGEAVRGEEIAPAGLGQGEHVLDVGGSAGGGAHHRRVERAPAQGEEAEEHDP